eukprot:5893888-Prorocentrum_lima.AAC.1
MIARTSPCQVILKDWTEGEDKFDVVDSEDQVPLTALESQCHKGEEDIVRAVQEVDDPIVLRTLAT